MTIETPNEYFPILILIPLFSGLIIGGIFNIRNSKGEDRFFIPFFSGFGISIIIIIIYGGIITEYTSQVMELINNEPCEGLPKIAVYDKGLKPSGWPEHWEWTHSWPRKYDKNNFCMFCEENIPDGLYYCDNCRREIGETSVFTIIGDTMSEDDVNQLKGLCC